MIITRTPMRISFLGGGSDYPAYFRQHGGVTLCTSIDKYTTISVQRLLPFFEYRLRVAYSKLERVATRDELQHPAVRACLETLELDRDLEIHYTADLPARTGLGTSSSFVVCLLHALHAYKHELASQWQLAREAIHVEQTLLNERVGSQDQCIAALGGLRTLTFNTDGTIHADMLPIRQERLELLQAQLMLFYTGICRTAHEVLAEQMEKTSAGTLDAPLQQMTALIPAAIDVLCSEQSLDGFGELLDAGWQLKQQLSSQISNPEIATWYAAARRAGAIGGKLLGAGAGGFLLFYVPRDRQAAVTAALHPLNEVPFRFEQDGSRLLFYHER